MRISGKTYLVTGGASGLGLEMVMRLVSLGARVVVLDKNEDALASISRDNGQILSYRCDITSPSSVSENIGKAWRDCGKIHGLINNAGLLHSAPLLGIGPSGLKVHDIDAWNSVIDINLNAVFYVTTSLVSHMVKTRTRGIVINISSISAAGNAGQGAYSAAKAGVEALTVTWAQELGPWGIRVAGLAPGFNETPSTHDAISQNILDHIRKEVPIGRLGEPAEVAHAIQFLIENDYMNGVTMKIDGGLRI